MLYTVVCKNRCESANSPPEIIVRGTIIPRGQGSYGPLSLGIIVLTGHSELDVDNYSNMYLIMIVIVSAGVKDRMQKRQNQQKQQK